MNRAQHYRAAEKLLERLDDRDNYRHGEDGYFDSTGHDTDLKVAQIHATLANVTRDVSNMAMDMEQTEPDSTQQRDWLLDPEPHELAVLQKEPGHE